MTEKVIGYLILVAGILLMVFSILEVYFAFTGKIKPYPLFNLPGISLDLGKFVSGEVPISNSEKPSNSSLKTELVEKELINQPLNFLAHLVLMGFLLNAGFKISSLGVQFLRPIKVNLKESTQVPLQNTPKI